MMSFTKYACAFVLAGGLATPALAARPTPAADRRRAQRPPTTPAADRPKAPPIDPKTQCNMARVS